MLSAFTFERRLPEALQSAPSALLVGLLLGVPLVSAATLSFARRMDAELERRSAAGDALIAWLQAFFFAAHIIILSVLLGLLPDLRPALDLAGGLLVVGAAGLLPGLPPRSPFGLVVPATRHPAAWKVAHRRLAVWLALVGAVMLAGTALAVPPLMGSFVACAFALLGAFDALRAARRARKNEQVDGPDRPESAGARPNP